MICVVKLCYAPRQTHILMTCTCNCSMHIQHNVMQLFHANSAPACTRSRSPHNVLHSPSLFTRHNFSPTRSVNIYIVRRAVNHFLLLFARSLLKLLQRTRYVDVHATYTLRGCTLLCMQRTSHVDYFAICV